MRSWVVVLVVVSAALLLLSGCAASDPRGEWQMREWSGPVHEGRAFYESKRRPWGERLQP